MICFISKIVCSEYADDIIACFISNFFFCSEYIGDLFEDASEGDAPAAGRRGKGQDRSGEGNVLLAH